VGWDVSTAPGENVSDHGAPIGPATGADSDLVSAFHSGDPSAYPEIYRRYRLLADAVCRRLLCNRDDAEEAAQETMLRVLQGLPRFDGNHLKAWVARIATNVCLDVLRSRTRRVENVESLPLDPGNSGNADDDPFEVVQRLAEEGRVHSLLTRLCQEQRVALVLREFHGLSHREIAIALGKSPAQVKALIHRARDSFRRTWDEEGRRHEELLLPAAALSGAPPVTPGGPAPDGRAGA
jgi:RNA polymerase sigma-70 factor, ECF subfamily